MVKILVSVILFSIAVYTAAVSGPLFRTFAETPLWVLLVTCLGYASGQVLSGIKWGLLVRASGIPCTVSNAVKAYYMGMFANVFGLGVVGGDLARALLLGREQKSKALATVAADRAHGLFTLSLIGTIGGGTLFLTGGLSQNPLFVCVLLLVNVGLLVLWYGGPALLSKVPGQHRLLEKVRALAAAFPKDPKVLLIATVISAMFHLLQIGLYFIMGRAYGVVIPLEFLLVAIPLTNIVSTLPITWNGLGVRENALAVFLVPAVIPATQAVAFGAIWLASVMVTSALGGLIAFWSKDFRALMEKKSLLEEQQ